MRTHTVEPAPVDIVGEADQAAPQSSMDAISVMEPAAQIGSKITKRSQFFVRWQNDLLPANRGQPPQCAADYGACHRRKKEALAPKCRRSRENLS
jgi:hypothetical protein